jgi:hypothetical protein
MYGAHQPKLILKRKGLQYTSMLHKFVCITSVGHCILSEAFNGKYMSCKSLPDLLSFNFRASGTIAGVVVTV